MVGEIKAHSIQWKSEERMDWYCYVCGKAIGKVFALMSMAERTDRVFLVCSPACTARVEDVIVLPVERIEEM